MTECFNKTAAELLFQLGNSISSPIKVELFPLRVIFASHYHSPSASLQAKIVSNKDFQLINPSTGVGLKN